MLIWSQEEQREHNADGEPKELGGTRVEAEIAGATVDDSFTAGKLKSVSFKPFASVRTTLWRTL